MAEFDNITIREEGNFAEQFNCVKYVDTYSCVYVDCGQLQHSCHFVLPKSDMDIIIRNCIGYFPSETHVDIIVNSDVFKKLMRKLSTEN